MTTPGGVPNLPQGALTLDTLASNLQDMSGGAMKDRAVERFPSIMDSSTGLSPVSDLTPFGILTRIFAEINSLIANADPADINGPEDIPGLLMEFIEGLPVVGQFVDLVQAILGEYDGADDMLLTIQQIFAPIRALMQQFAGIVEGFPDVDQITSGVTKFLGAFEGLDLTNPGAVLTAIGDALQGVLGEVVNALTGISGGDYGDLTDWAGQLADDIGSLSSQLGQLVHNLLTTPASVLGDIPQSLVSGLDGALNNIDEGIQNLIDGLISALRRIPIVGGSIANAIDALADFTNDTQDNAVNQQNAAIANAAAGGYRNPSWVCRYPIADVTFAEIINVVWGVGGTTGAPSLGTAHTHILPGLGGFDEGLPYSYGSISVKDIAAGESIFGIITMTNSGVIDTVAISCRTPATSINNVYLELLRMNNADGTAKQVASVEVSGMVHIGVERYLEASIPGVIAQAGESYLFRIRNSTTNGADLGVNAARISTFLNTRCGYATAASGLAGNTTYTATQLETVMDGAPSIPWAMVAVKNPAPVDYTYTDDFNRKELGSLWATSSDIVAQPRIYNNWFRHNGTPASGTSVQSALHTVPTNSDSARVEANLAFNPGTLAQGLDLHCDREYTQKVRLSVTPSTAAIVTVLDGTTTSRASVSTGGDALWAIYYDEANDKYVVEKNGAGISLEWPSVSTTVEHGSDFCYGGLFVTASTTAKSGHIDNFTLRDWAPPITNPGI